MRWLLLFPALLVGCDDHLFPVVGGETGYDPDYAGMEGLMRDHCVECHPVIAAPVLPDAIATDVLDGTGTYVVAGEPLQSEFYLVMVGQSAITGQMPANGNILSEEITQAVFDWIEAGAVLE